MIKRNRFRRAGVLMLASLLSCAMLAGCGKKDEVASGKLVMADSEEDLATALDSAKASGSDTLHGESLSFKIAYGFNGYVKYGEYVRFVASIANEGADASGKFQIILPEEGNKNILYQTPYSVQEGETTQVEMVLPLNSTSEKCRYQFTDETESVITKKTVVLKLNNNQNTTFIGAVSSNTDSLDYLENESSKLFYLDKSQITDDYLGYESLDILVLDSLDQLALTKEQYQSLLHWTENGGSLILSKKEDIQILKTLEGYRDLDVEQVQKDSYFTEYPVGFGGIFLAEIPLSMNAAQVRDMGTKVLARMLANQNEIKQQNGKNAYSSPYYNYGVLDVLRIPDLNEIPRISGYVIAILLYLMVSGPLMYMILKKRDKRNLTWVLVPLYSVLFAFIIYLLGSGTRISKPVVNYISYTTIQKDGDTSEDIYFSIMPEDNKDHQVTYLGDSTIGAISSQYSYAMVKDTTEYDYSDYATNVNRTAQRTDITIKNSGAFVPAYFNIKEQGSVQGTYEYEIQDSISSIDGTFTNSLGYDLDHAALISNGTILPLGNIKNAETISVSDKGSASSSLAYTAEYETLIGKITGGSRDSKKPEVLRRWRALESYLEHTYSNWSKSNFLIAFAKEPGGNQWMKGLSLENTGMKVVILPLSDIRSTTADGTWARLEEYLSNSDGNYIDAYRNVSGEIMDVDYSFDDPRLVTGLQYTKRNNPEFDKKSQTGFFGQVYLFNQITKTYDQVFESGREGMLSSMGSYIDENGIMKVRYQTKVDAMQTKVALLPQLMVHKEVK